MTNPLVTIIIPTYNRINMVAKAIQSAVSQTYKNLEIIVVNDCGHDVQIVIDTINDPRIKYVQHIENKGLGAARNTGIANSTGKYIGYLDDDDWYFPEHVRILVEKMEQDNIDVIYSNAIQNYQQAQPDGRYATLGRHMPYDMDFVKDMLLYQNITPVLCIMHARECLDKTGVFDENLKVYEDWDLWIRMSRHYDFHHMRVATCEYVFKQDGSTMSSSRNEFSTLLPEIYDRYKEHITSLDIIKIQDEMMAKRGVSRIA